VSAGLLLRTIRLDASDTVIFASPAEPGEWAVAGGFLWPGRDPERMGRKERIAFRSGFVGIASFGFSTLAVVSEARAAEREEAVVTLADAFVARLGAPDRATALPAAEEEIAYSETLCDGHAPGTLIALHRSLDASGAIREQFRTLKPRAETSLAGGHLRGHDRAFSVVETDAPEDTDERVDLVALLRGRRS
jgi:hypothetical protein